MGCGPSACADDASDWDNLASKAGIANTRWDCYSNEARFAKDGYRNHKHTGRRLKLYVRHQMELRDLKIKQAKDVADLEKLAELEAQFT